MNILVIGDFCEDVFVYGECKRLCPEAPVPVFNPIKEESNYGMAGNVYKNIASLLDDDSIVSGKWNFNNTTKTRFVDIQSNQMLMRLDENDNAERINWDKCDISSDLDAIVVSDYNKGFLDIEDIGIIGTKAKQYNIPVFIDTKKKLTANDTTFFNDIFCVKINEKELNESKSFYDWNYRGNLIITLGSNGCNHIDRNRNPTPILHYGIDKKAEVRDLSGAGDTFLAGLVVEYVRTKDFSKAIEFANRCASWVVTQKGVVVVDKSKI